MQNTDSDSNRRQPPVTDSRRRQALVGVRLSEDEYATLRDFAERTGQTLPGALRDTFLNHASR